MCRLLDPIARVKQRLLASVLVLVLVAWTGVSYGQGLGLTPEERARLDAHPTIRLGPAPNFPPVEFYDSSGVLRGLAPDYVALIGKSLGVRFEPVRCESWDEVLTRTAAGEIDAWAEAAATPERERTMRFSQPFLELPTVLITHSDEPGGLRLEGMRGRKLVVVQGYATHDYVRTRHPEIDLITVPDIETGLRLVSFKTADAMVASLAAASYYVETAGLTNLRVGGEAGYTWRLSFATRKDWPLLASAVQKALDAIGAEERQRLYRRWVGFKPRPWRPSGRQVALGAGFFGLVALVVVLGWNRTLQARVRGRTAELDRELGERRRAEEALSKSERAVRAVLDSVDAAVLVLDAEGVVRDCNTTAASLFQRSEDELQGEPFPLALLAMDDAEWDDERRMAFGGVAREFERPARRADDEPARDFEIVLRPLILGRAPHVLVCLRDVSERKRLARIQSEFVSVVSHELRTPITSIYGSLRLLQNLFPAELPAEATELLAVTNRNATRLISLVNDIIDVERLERGALEFQIAPHSLAGLLTEGLEINRPYADRFQASLVGEWPDDVQVAVDSDRFAQVMSNLISNAAKFSEPGGRIEVSAALAGEGAVRIGVRDRGPGVPEGFQSRIFQRFAQADSSVTREVEGTGLGLAICKAIVERMNGSIGYDTVEGEGSTFWFELPLAAGSPTQAQEPKGD